MIKKRYWIYLCKDEYTLKYIFMDRNIYIRTQNLDIFFWGQNVMQSCFEPRTENIYN